jgi:hypothetical protein
VLDQLEHVTIDSEGIDVVEKAFGSYDVKSGLLI